MHPDLKTRRRVFVHASQSYVCADAAWHRGLHEATAFVPDAVNRSIWKIGNPGSRIRKLYEERDHALQRLVVARLKFQVAKARLLDRESRSHKATLFFACQREFG